MANSALSLARTSGYLANVGQCILQYVSTSIVRLNRHNGRLLFLNGAYEEIPAAGVDLANTALGANDTTYFVYAYLSSGTMTLEASATAYATDSTYGHKIKNGDATRTLVGMVRKTGGNFVNTSSTCLTRSWFHDLGLAIYVAIPGGSFASAPWVEYSTSARAAALFWAGETVQMTAGWGGYNAGAQDTLYAVVGLDGSASGGAGIMTTAGASVHGWVSGSYVSNSGVSEGYHYATLLVGNATGTATINAGYGGVTILTGGSGA